MRNLVRYNLLRKKKLLVILSKLVQGLQSGRLVLSEYGVWDSRTDNSLNFKIKVISRDSEKELKKFEEFS